MNPIVELNEDGGLYLPATILQAVQPHTRFLVKVDHGVLVLYPEEPQSSPQLPLWETATPQEQADSLMQWIESMQEGSGLPAEALGRESIYE